MKVRWVKRNVVKEEPVQTYSWHINGDVSYYRKVTFQEKILQQEIDGEWIDIPLVDLTEEVDE